MYNAEIMVSRWADKHTFWIEFAYYGSKGKVVKEVYGQSNCQPTDKYNEEFGRNLAETKAFETYYHEVKKLMIAETYRPEWKKKQKMSFEGEYIKGGIYHIKDYDRVVKEAKRKFGKGKSVKVTVEEI